MKTCLVKVQKLKTCLVKVHENLSCKGIQRVQKMKTIGSGPERILHTNLLFPVVGIPPESGTSGCFGLSTDLILFDPKKLFCL